MANITQLNTRLITRHDTEANWLANDPTLMAGEIAITDPDDSHPVARFKVGVDNIKTWRQIDYCFNTEELLDKINNIKPTTENTYFTEDMTVTYQFGKYAPDSTGSVVVPTKDKSVYEALLDAFAEAKEPTVDQPSVSISASGGSKEVGETFALPTATLKIDDVGSYQYGSKDAADIKYDPAETGVTFAAGDITLSCGSKSVSNEASMDKGDTLTLTAEGSNTTYGDTAVSFTFTATAKHTESDRVPLNNLGSKVAGLQIVSGSTTVANKVVSFTGYRKPFWGYKLTADSVDVVDVDGKCILTSDQIRGLQKNGGTVRDLPTSYKVPKDTKQVFFAAKKGTKSSLTVKNVTKEPATSVACTKYTDVSVAGANGAASTAYDVWVINLDAAFTGETSLSLTWA